MTMKTLTFEKVPVYLPDEARAQIEQIAAERGLEPQELFDFQMAINRHRWSRELTEKANGVLKFDEPWPNDPLEALCVGAMYAFLLAEHDDNVTGRWCQDPHYVDLEEIFPEKGEASDASDWWKFEQ